MFRNYKRASKDAVKSADEFILFVSKNMDGRTFTMFNKYLNELRSDVLLQKNHKVSADSFLIFLDKM